MGDRDNRDSSPDTLTHAKSEDERMMKALRDAKLSTASDARGLISDTLKKLTINGHGVIGSGLSFTIGNTGLGIDAATQPQAPALQPSEPVDLLPLRGITLNEPPLPQVERRVIEPLDIPPIPGVRPLSPDDPPPDLNLPSGGHSTPQGSGIPTIITGAVNGAPATITLLAIGAWAELED